ncbi:syntaxin-11-like [Corythoichthys intestinalis]|uniref:syntaxin-11-like n=1 Tax=Corythoichthys intestinalis TaxID=161448 RepID=UPI0025A527BD|nr:syntaxin-11-like [Corythoichthys intestinalis]
MRDMLERLRNVSEDLEDDDNLDYDKSKLPTAQEIVFENSLDIESILKEAESIRKDISLLLLEIQRLKKNDERFRTTVRHLATVKRDSDEIARGIQKQGQLLHTRILALGAQSKMMERKEGPNSASSRIACMQFDSLILAFQTAMGSYNQTEEMQRSLCRERIQRQASILGTKITDEKLDEIIDKGCEGWNELSQSLPTTHEGHSSRWAMTEIKDRHNELVALEARLREVHELFQDVAALTEEQCSMINNIEANVAKTQNYTQKANVEITKAWQYKRKNPFLQCCPCLPCWNK